MMKPTPEWPGTGPSDHHAEVPGGGAPGSIGHFGAVRLREQQGISVLHQLVDVSRLFGVAGRVGGE